VDRKTNCSGSTRLGTSFVAAQHGMNYWARESGLQELFVAVQQSRYDVLNPTVFSPVRHPMGAGYPADQACLEAEPTIRPNPSGFASKSPLSELPA
jgi:hypothetical protein